MADDHSKIWDYQAPRVAGSSAEDIEAYLNRRHGMDMERQRGENARNLIREQGSQDRTTNEQGYGRADTLYGRDMKEEASRAMGRMASLHAKAGDIFKADPKGIQKGAAELLGEASTNPRLTKSGANVLGGGNVPDQELVDFVPDDAQGGVSAMDLVIEHANKMEKEGFDPFPFVAAWSDRVIADKDDSREFAQKVAFALTKQKGELDVQKEKTNAIIQGTREGKKLGETGEMTAALKLVELSKSKQNVDNFGNVFEESGEVPPGTLTGARKEVGKVLSGEKPQGATDTEEAAKKFVAGGIKLDPEDGNKVQISDEKGNLIELSGQGFSELVKAGAVSTDSNGNKVLDLDAAREYRKNGSISRETKRRLAGKKNDGGTLGKSRKRVAAREGTTVPPKELPTDLEYDLEDEQSRSLRRQGQSRAQNMQEDLMGWRRQFLNSSGE